MKTTTFLTRYVFAFSLYWLIGGSFAHAQKSTSIVVDAGKPGPAIQPTMWGIFFEDINFAADGGLYSQLVKNSSFEFDDRLMGWQQPNSNKFSLNENSGMATVISIDAPANRHYLRVDIKNSAGYELRNDGFRGIGIKEGASYTFSVKIRKLSGLVNGLKIQLIDSSGNSLGQTDLSFNSKEWTSHTASLTARKTEAKAQLMITFQGNGVVDLDMVSLFPKDTWMGRPGGLRKDLVQLLADLKPGFMRFPGGCIVEGRTLEQRYQWKKTVGDPENRELLINRWNTEFAHRPAPDYFQSFGLGFYEYFQMAEDIGAEPLPILGCGMACQFNTAELAPLDQMDPYLQDALDLIEFANGSAESNWGKVRADMGHPKPFNLKFIGIGNEQWGPEYFARLEFFMKVIKANYPDIIIVSSAGPFAEGEHFNLATSELKRLKAELVDEHYYKAPNWFLENAGRYDSYDRNSYKIFAGEYAAHSATTGSADNKNNWQCALAEAAYMTGLERNADIVHLASYAPLFGHVDAWQWTPNLIWFDNLGSFGTLNYKVQKLYSTNRGTNIASTLSEGQPLKGQKDIYASSVIDENQKEIIVKLVNTGNSEKSIEIEFTGARRLAKSGYVTQLYNSDLSIYNTIDHPDKILPVEKSVAIKGKNLQMSLPAYSLSIVKVKLH